MSGKNPAKTNKLFLFFQKAVIITVDILIDKKGGFL